MNKGRVGEERGGKEMDICPLTDAQMAFESVDISSCIMSFCSSSVESGKLCLNSISQPSQPYIEPGTSEKWLMLAWCYQSPPLLQHTSGQASCHLSLCFKSVKGTTKNLSPT
jgi:hypothetical protein